jgi:hypothetical protein
MLLQLLLQIERCMSCHVLPMPPPSLLLLLLWLDGLRRLALLAAPNIG